MSRPETPPAAKSKRRDMCRHCGARPTHPVMDLGATPFANAFLPNDPAAIAAETSHPLSAQFCARCLLVQLADPAPAEALFTPDYAYFSSWSSTWLAHAERFVDTMAERLSLGPESFVVEVASNDGYLLRHAVARGIRCLGVDPAADCAAAAAAHGVETDVAFFGRARAEAIRAARGPADLIVANNVLAHVPDLGDFVGGFAALLAPQGRVSVEFPHLLRMIDQVQFDTIYHEHYSYLSLMAVERLFAEAGLTVVDVETLPTHGGSLRVIAALADGAPPPSAAVAAVRDAERAARLDRPEGYADFAWRADARREAFIGFLDRAAAAGARVAGYGAAAKGVTFLNYCGVGPDQIAFLVDKNPAKQNRLSPGGHLPIAPPSALAESKPDFVVILPWNLRDEIVAEHSYISTWGGRFVVAAPTLEILSLKTGVWEAAA